MDGIDTNHLNRLYALDCWEYLGMSSIAYALRYSTINRRSWFGQLSAEEISQ